MTARRLLAACGNAVRHWVDRLTGESRSNPIAAAVAPSASSDEWYETADPGAPLLQGDFIPDCPVLDWKPGALEGAEGVGEVERLRHHIDIVKVDVIVLTQACDLEQGHVEDVVVCPLYPLSVFKAAWEQQRRAANQNPTAKAWRTFCDDMKDGFHWNYSMLNQGGVGGLTTEHRIVDFHDIYTLPLAFLQGIAAQRGPRLRLRPPYREHLSQAFARYFMRVGLPTSVDPTWKA